MDSYVCPWFKWSVGYHSGILVCPQKADAEVAGEVSITHNVRKLAVGTSHLNNGL